MLRKLRQWWESRETSGLRQPERWFKDLFGLEETAAGVEVSEQSALKYTAVFACVRVLSESIAGLPLHLYRRDGEARERASDHPLYSVLHDSPNGYQTSYEFRQLLMVHLLLWGNAYAEIVRDTAGNVVELLPIPPDRIRLKSENGKVFYQYFPGAETIDLPLQKVLHIRGLSVDGWMGLSPIAAARQSIGLSLAAEKFGAAYFGKGSRVGGAIEVPVNTSGGKVAEIREAWDKVYTTPSNWHRVAVLEGGMKFTPFTFSAEDAQFHETRRFGVEDIARIFRVPPHMLADLSKANYSNVDALDRQFAKYSLTPWTSNIEQAMSLKLLGPRQRHIYFIEHDMNGLLRGDHESRMKSYQAGIYCGIYSPNEARRMENLPPREGGEIYLQPTNTSASPYTPQQGAQ